MRCEFEVWHGERYWVAIPLGMEGATQGLTREDAIESAADWLREEIDYAAARGQELPAPAEGLPLQHGGERVAVVVDERTARLDAIFAAANERREAAGLPEPSVEEIVASSGVQGRGCPFCGGELVTSWDPIPPEDGEDEELAGLYAAGVEHTACSGCGFVTFTEEQADEIHRAYWRGRGQRDG